MEIKEFYAQSLGIQPPWRVTGVAILPESKTIEVRVKCDEDVLWADPETGQRATIHAWRERRWRHLDTCEFETWVIAKVPRIKLSSGTVINARVPWAEDYGRFTKAMETRLILVLKLCSAVSSAAAIARISRYEAEGVMRRAVNRGLDRRVPEELQLLGIDEKSIGKGHRYATVLIDLVGERVIDVGEERTKEAVISLLDSLPETSTRTVEAVAMDMWPAFIGAVEERLPDAAIVFDRFHVKGYLNRGVDLVRRQEHRRLSAAGNMVLKGTKYQWLKTHEDMRTKSAVEFRELLVQNLQTGTAWALKELFDHLWTYKSRSHAMRFIYSWVESVNDSGLTPMITASATIMRHMAGILNYISFPITNASSEGMNSIIQSLRCAARGLPNFANFRARILFHLGKLDMLPS
jgi:transposase